MPVKATPKNRNELTRSERVGPFDPMRLYHLNDILEVFGITKRQAHRWMYERQNPQLPYVELNGKGRRMRGRDLNRFINDRLVEGD